MHFLALKIGTASVFIETPKHWGKMKTIWEGCRIVPNESRMAENRGLRPTTG